MPRLTPPRDASKVTLGSMGTTRRPADEAGVDGAAPRARRPLLGRLSVGAKLMLLVLLPVGVLLLGAHPLVEPGAQGRGLRPAYRGRCHALRLHDLKHYW